jgi:uncharacterized membrane protein
LYNHSDRLLASQIEYRCNPIAFEVGTTAPVMMLFLENNDPETGSRILSMSTAGALMNAMINTVVAVNNVGIIKTLDHLM